MIGTLTRLFGGRSTHDRREARLRRTELRHVKWQTWLGLVGLVLAAALAAVELWPEDHDSHISFGEPSSSPAGATLVIEGRVFGLRDGEEALLRSGEGRRKVEIPLQVDPRNRFFVQILDPTRFERLQLVAIDRTGETVEGPTLEVASPQDAGGELDQVVDIEISNLVVVDEDSMREDDVAAYLMRTPQCIEQECWLPGTGFASGDVADAVCQVEGRLMTNGYGSVANPDTYESKLWYGVATDDGRLGYQSEVWVAERHRGGLSLPQCPDLPESARP